MGLAGVVAAVERGVVEEQLPVEADQLGTLVQAVRVRWLWGDKPVETHSNTTKPTIIQTHAHIFLMER